MSKKNKQIPFEIALDSKKQKTQLKVDSKEYFSKVNSFLKEAKKIKNENHLFSKSKILSSRIDLNNEIEYEVEKKGEKKYYKLKDFKDKIGYYRVADYEGAKQRRKRISLI